MISWESPNTSSGPLIWAKDLPLKISIARRLIDEWLSAFNYDDDMGNIGTDIRNIFPHLLLNLWFPIGQIHNRDLLLLSQDTLFCSNHGVFCLFQVHKYMRTKPRIKTGKTIIPASGPKDPPVIHSSPETVCLMIL